RIRVRGRGRWRLAQGTTEYKRPVFPRSLKNKAPEELVSLHELEKRPRSVAQRTRLCIEKAHLPLDVQLLDVDFAQRAALDVLPHGHAWQERDAVAAGD